MNRILREEAMRQGIKVASGKKLHDIEMTGEQGVIATFADGPAAEGSVLLGCDGIHSRSRPAVHRPDEYRRVHPPAEVFSSSAWLWNLGM